MSLTHTLSHSATNGHWEFQVSKWASSMLVSTMLWQVRNLWRRTQQRFASTRIALFLYLLLVASVSDACAFGGSATSPSIGQVAPSFVATDSSGKTRSLDEFKGKIVVLEWSSSGCPFAAAQYRSKRIPTMQRWARGHNVVWLTVLSAEVGRSGYLNPAQAAVFNTSRGGEPTALLIDGDASLLKKYGAKTANHFFIIDKSGRLAYMGGVDDSQSMNPEEILKSNSYVMPALEAMIADQKVKNASTTPFGCVIASSE